MEGPNCLRTKQPRLILADGSEHVLQNSCSIGRTPGNDVILPQDKISRRHALIHAQEHGRFCFVDLGSSNGSYINGRRVVQPVILKDRDQIDLGPVRIVFRDASDSMIVEARDGQLTLHEIRTVDLWLMVADVIDSTRLHQLVSDTEIPQITGRWLADCKNHIEAHGGSINKFLGDGLLAYWPSVTDPSRIAMTVRTLRGMQESHKLPFRVVLHRGQVLLGGAGSLGEENLTGRDVNFVFRMEKLAGLLRQGLLLSAEARKALENEFSWTEAGRHSLTGFDGDFVFWIPG